MTCGAVLIKCYESLHPHICDVVLSILSIDSTESLLYKRKNGENPEDN